jgi:hypothetical protein
MWQDGIFAKKRCQTLNWNNMTNGNIFVLAFNVAIVVFVSPWWLLATITVTIGYFVLYSQSDGEKMKQMLTKNSICAHIVCQPYIIKV